MRQLGDINRDIEDAVSDVAAGKPGATQRAIELGREREERLKPRRLPPEYHFRHQLSTPGKRLLKLRAIRAYNYRQPTDFGFVFNWWHPISWILIPLLVPVQLALHGRKSWEERWSAGLGYPPGHDHPKRAEKRGLQPVEWMKISDLHEE